MRRSESEAGSDVMIPVLGLPVRLATSSRRLRAAFLELYGGWSGAGIPLSSGPGITLRAELGGATGAAREPPLIRASAHRLVVRGSGVRGVARAAEAGACCELAPWWLDHPRRLKAEVLDTLVLFLLTRQDRLPLHAAGLVAGDVAAVLAGPAGTGKSTLALEGSRAGLQLLSEDAVYIQTRPPGRVWGWPGAIHIAQSQAERLGWVEVSGHRLRGGKAKAAVELGSAGGVTRPVSYQAQRSALFLLRAGRGAPALQPVSRDAAATELAGTIQPGFDIFRASIEGVVRVAGSEGCWRLTLGADPADALELVMEVLRARR